MSRVASLDLSVELAPKMREAESSVSHSIFMINICVAVEHQQHLC